MRRCLVMGGGNTVKGRDIIVPKHRVISIRVHALRWLILDQVIAGKKDRELFATVQVGGKRMTTKRRVSMIEDDEDEEASDWSILTLPLLLLLSLLLLLLVLLL